MYKKTLSVLLILLALMLAGSAFAGTKFINKDTAKDRKPVTFGTSSNTNSNITIKSNKSSNVMSIKPKEKKENENPAIGPIFVVPEIKP